MALDAPSAQARSGTTGVPRSFARLAVWTVPGFLLAFAVASLPSIGTLVLPFAVIVLVVAALATRGRGASGILLGAGLVGLLLAWLNRDGYARTCVAPSCEESFDPVPFLAAGLVAIAAGVVAEVVVRFHAGRRGSGHLRAQPR